MSLPWFIVCLLVTLCSPVEMMHGSCFGKNRREIRAVVIKAITQARISLGRQKEINKFFSQIGHDEKRNRSPFMPMTCYQHHAVYSHLNKHAFEQVDSGFIVQFATKEIIQTLGIGLEDILRCPRFIAIWRELISPFCTRRYAICDADSKYRTIDGSCNNLQNPLWGRSNRPHGRFLKPQYMDDIGLPRQTGIIGDLLLSPRTVSNVVHNQDPCCPLEEKDLSQYVQQWGQLLDHDLTDTAFARGTDNAVIMCCNLSQETLKQRSECFPINIMPGDSRFTEPCMNFVRSNAAHSDNCDIGRRNQLNQATSFIDASFLYGHNNEDARKLRSFIDGKLRMTVDGLFPSGQEDLTQCVLENQDEYCMKSGDFRIHELAGLTAVQIMFLREHNRIADILQKLNAYWCDEDIYQEARKIVIGQVQHITYDQWLPLIIGERLTMQMGLATSPTGHTIIYNKNTNPTISNVFGVAAFRFGHSLLRDTVLFQKDKGLQIRNELVFNRPTLIFSENRTGTSFVGLGLSINPSSKADGQVVNSIRNNLFLDMNGRSLDLVSLNIQRGRDHGVPGYNKWRRFCGLPFAMHFHTGPGGLVDHTTENANKLYSVYRHPEDIDVFAGGLSENLVEGGLVGPLFSCIIGHQFHNLKYGDRFYYENYNERTGFTYNQTNSVKKITLAKLMCLHFHIAHVQINPFRRSGPKNPKINCNKIDDIDFALWKM